MATDMIARAMAGNTKKELDNYKNNPDVVDVVQDKAALDAYDTTKLTENDLVKVLDDESRNHMQTYYKWANNNWTYCGGLGPKADLTNDRQVITASQIKAGEFISQVTNNRYIDMNSFNAIAIKNEGVSSNSYVTLNDYDLEFKTNFNSNESASVKTYYVDNSGHIYLTYEYYNDDNDFAFSTIDLSKDKVFISQEDENKSNVVELTPTSFTHNNNEIIDAGNISDYLPAKQDPIDVDHKLDADLVSDDTSTNKFVTANEKSQITTNANAIAAIKNGATLNSFGDVENALAGITPSHLYRMHLKIGTDYVVVGITPTIDAFEVGQTYTVYNGTYRLTSDQRTAMKKVLSGISGNETEVPLQLYGALVNKTTRTCIELTDFSGTTQVKLDFNSTSNNVYTAGGTWTLKFTQLN